MDLEESMEQVATTDGETDDNADTPLVSLLIRAVDGREAALSVPYSIQVPALSELVALEFSEPVDRVRLIYRGKRLNPDDTLEQYIARSAVDETHCLHVVFRVVPPEPPRGAPADSSRRPSNTTTTTGRSGTVTVSHSLPAGLLMDAFRLGPTTQFSVSGASDMSGAGQAGILGGPAFLQTLMSSLAAAAVNAPTGSTPVRGSAAAGGASHGEMDDDDGNNRSEPSTPLGARQSSMEQRDPASAVAEAVAEAVAGVLSPREDSPEQPVSASAVSTAPAGVGVPHDSASNATASAGVADQAARPSEGTSSQPQQVRVTVGPLPVALSSASLGQFFQSVVDQLGPSGSGDGHEPLSGSRAQRYSTSTPLGVIVPDHTTAPSSHDRSRTDGDARRAARTGSGTTPAVAPGLPGFLRRTLGRLVESGGSVTRAIETVFGTLQESVSQEPGGGGTSTQLRSAGIIPLSQRQTGTSPFGTAGRPAESIWVSNESISEKLPWSTLKQLAQVVRRATGWELPDLSSSDDRRQGAPSSPPLARFLLMYQQLKSVSSALLTQVEAWQRGSGRLGVTDIGHCIEIFALSSTIDAHLAALFSWLFLNLSRYVDPATLHERMEWEPFSAAQQPSGREPTASAYQPEEDDDAAFVDAHESPPALDGTASTPQQHALGETFASEAQPQPSPALPASRKRTNDEDSSDSTSSSGSSSTPEAMLDDTSTAKKQRTSRSSVDSPLQDTSSAVVRPGSAANQEDCSPSPSESVQAEPRADTLRRLSLSTAAFPPMIPSCFTLQQLQPGRRPPETSNTPPSQESTASRSATATSQLRGLVRDRYEQWTSNPTMFSRAVIGQARLRPFSDAYTSGNLTSSPNDRQGPPAVDSLLGLSWRQAASRVNIPSEYIEPVPDHLRRPYVALLLRDVIDQAHVNPDFREEPHRFTHIREALRVLQDVLGRS